MSPELTILLVASKCRNLCGRWTCCGQRFRWCNSKPRQTMRSTIRILSAILVIGLSGAARADDYFVVVFGAQSDPKRPKFSHSWATFVRLAPNCAPEVVTISWMPCTLELRPNRPFAETGVNLDLHKSFDVTLAHCEKVMAWGPFRIDCELFERAKTHACRLQNGEIKYKTIDFARNPMRVSNCVHALTVFNPENRRLRIGRTNFGHTASYYIAESYKAWIAPGLPPEYWVADLLGLGQYPICWRTVEQGPPKFSTANSFAWASTAASKMRTLFLLASHQALERLGDQLG